MQQTSRSGTMEGRARTSGVVAMKATMHGMLLQGVGLGDQILQRARWFNLPLDDDIEHMIYLNAVRIDHATESVVPDVAVLSSSVEHAALDQSPILHEACKVGVKITINQTSRREKRGGSCCLQHAKCAGRIGSTTLPRAPIIKQEEHRSLSPRTFRPTQGVNRCDCKM